MKKLTETPSQKPEGEKAVEKIRKSNETGSRTYDNQTSQLIVRGKERKREKREK
jgi:hypothetical protein